jgi:hypothetical protein
MTRMVQCPKCGKERPQWKWALGAHCAGCQDKTNLPLYGVCALVGVGLGLWTGSLTFGLLAFLAPYIVIRLHRAFSWP